MFKGIEDSIQNSFVYSRIGDNPKEVDFALIIKEKNKGVVIGKLINLVIVADLSIMSSFDTDQVKVLEYHELDSYDQAYEKMMVLIGKMIKRTPESLSQLKKDNGVNEYTKDSVRSLINVLKEEIEESTKHKKLMYTPMELD